MFDLAGQFAGADTIVIAAPFWDLSFPAALKQYMQAHLEAFKVPKQIEIVEELPKTSNGKLDRKRLK